jgi:hypothetical protein
MKFILNSNDAEQLFLDLCVKLGFCLTERDRAYIMLVARTAEEFAQEVYIAEGLNPMLGSDLYKTVLKEITKVYQRYSR